MAEKPPLRRTGRRKFLEKISQGYSIRASCLYAGVPRKTITWYRKNDPEFRQDYEEAVEAGTEVLEDRARKRAMEQSDTLMIFLLKARRPDKYRENSHFFNVQASHDFTGAADSLRAKAAGLFAEEEKTKAPRKPGR